MHRLRDCIEAWCRRLQNHNKYPSLGGHLHPSKPMNRLDFILDEPDFVPPDLDKMSADSRKAALKTWNENGARVWRMVLKDLQEIAPTLDRPKGRGKTKDAQLALHDFYHALCVIDDYLQYSTPTKPSGRR